MLRRSAFQPKRPPAKVERVRTPTAAVSPLFRQGAPVDQAVRANPKDARKENPRLLAMARGMPCLLRIPGVCNGDPETTVAAHSNWREHGGKGAHRKADDCYSVWACSACHLDWLDTGPALRAVKKMAFMRAHMDQVGQWRVIATDPSRPEADRRAARWALDHLNASQIGEAP